MKEDGRENEGKEEKEEGREGKSVGGGRKEIIRRRIGGEERERK